MGGEGVCFAGRGKVERDGGGGERGAEVGGGGPSGEGGPVRDGGGDETGFVGGDVVAEVLEGGGWGG